MRGGRGGGSGEGGWDGVRGVGRVRGCVGRMEYSGRGRFSPG